MSPLVFPALQPGRYRIQIQLPGAARWESDDIELGADAVETQAVLQRGADVHIVLVATGVDPKRTMVPFTLLQNGKSIYPSLNYDYDYDRHTFRGLPPGEYSLKVPDSAEQLARRGSQNEQIPDSLGYVGTEVSFTVTESSPPLLDLGTVQLQSAKR